ncbi:MAG: 16S rRNA (guanine(527)-N(7))-methyltransferase RsmG [Chloroflexota bacterium]
MDARDRSSLPRHASPPTRAALPRDVADTPALDPVFGEVIARGLTNLGLTLDPAARAAIDDHARLLMAWNEHVNLSGLRTPELVARGHVLDSLIAVPVLRELAGAAPTVLDLGSGGGFPGLPLAVALPASRAALVDSIRKKAAFLEAAAATAKDVVAITVLAQRAEDLADQHDQREAWDIVTARAFGPIAEVAELGLPLVKIGGHVVAWKSAGPEGQLQAELAEADRFIRLVGGDNARIIELPAADSVGLGGHCLVVIDKLRPTPDGYPRQPGERRRRPLP